MKQELFADILKSHDTLQNIEFKINNKEYTFYYRYLTVLEHTRIKIACTKENVIIKENGSKEIKTQENEHLYPIYTILEKSLDKDGNKLFSLTSLDDFQKISKLPFNLVSFIASEMSFDITGNIKSLFGADNE